MRPPSTDLKASCALLLTGTQCGTGFLVSADRLLTCAHVIKDAGDGPIVATFTHGRYEAVVDLVDVQNDCALLLLKQPVSAKDAQPLVIATEPVPRSGEWLGYGFPAVVGSAGLLIDGRVQDPQGQDLALRSAVVLQSANVTAGSWLSGFSGSPVLLSGKVIGQLRTIIPDESGGAQLAVIYACPAVVLAELTQKRLGARALQSRNPYHGLDAYSPDDAADFFGREALTEKLWQRFRTLYSNRGQPRLLAVLGPSGSGKSSVTLAGLVPALRARPIPGPLPPRIILCRPGNHPVESLARALLPLLPPSDSVLAASRILAIEQLLLSESSKREGLRRYAAELPDIVSAPLVLVVDQFEEIYTHCEVKAERDAFVGLIQHAVTHRERHLAVVMTLRSDFLGEMQREHPELTRVASEQAELVTAMNPEEIRRAIAMPAERAGRPLDAATVELLLAQTREAALPLLAVALTRIWEEMIAGKAASATVREIGGVGGALAGQAQQLYDALSDAEKAIARRALVRLVRFGDGSRDTRRRRPVQELCGRDVTEAQVLSILRRFSMEGSRLLSLSGSGGNQVAEVAHEALFEHWTEFRRWIEEGRADHRFHERLVEAAKLWQEASRAPGRLWRPPDLDLLRDYVSRRGDEPSDLETAFYTEATQQWNAERATQEEVDRKLRAAAEENAQLKAQLSRHEQSRKPQAEVGGRAPDLPASGNVGMGGVFGTVPAPGSAPGVVRPPASVPEATTPAADTAASVPGGFRAPVPTQEEASAKAVTLTKEAATEATPAKEVAAANVQSFSGRNAIYLDLDGDRKYSTVISLSMYETFQTLLNAIYFLLLRKRKIPSYSYGSEWILVDSETRQVIVDFSWLKVQNKKSFSLDKTLSATLPPSGFGIRPGGRYDVLSPQTPAFGVVCDQEEFLALLLDPNTNLPQLLKEDVLLGMPPSGSVENFTFKVVQTIPPGINEIANHQVFRQSGGPSPRRPAAAALPRPKPGPLLARGADWLIALQRLRRDAVFATRLGPVSQDLAVDVANLERWFSQHPEHSMSVDESLPLGNPQEQHLGGKLIAALLATRLPSRVPRNEVHTGNMTVAAGQQRIILGSLRVDGNLLVRGKLLVLGHLHVDRYLRDSRLERAELIVAGDLRCREGMVSRGFVGVGGRLAAPYVHLSSNQGCTKILDGCEARLFIKSGHDGSRIFGPLRIGVLLADELKVDDDAKKPRSKWNDVLAMLPPALQKEVCAQDPGALGAVLSEHLQKTGLCPLLRI